jgi:hypothetical protein
MSARPNPFVSARAKTSDAYWVGVVAGGGFGAVVAVVVGGTGGGLGAVVAVVVGGGGGGGLGAVVAVVGGGGGGGGVVDPVICEPAASCPVAARKLARSVNTAALAAPRDQMTSAAGVDALGRAYTLPFAVTPICSAVRRLV